MIYLQAIKKFYQFIEDLAQYSFGKYMDAKHNLLDKLDRKADLELTRHSKNMEAEWERHQMAQKIEDMRHFSTVADIGNKIEKVTQI